MSITVAAFASAAPGSETGPRSGQNEPKTGYVYNHFQAVEGDVMILSKGGEDGEKQYSVDGGKTWLSEEDYRARYYSMADGDLYQESDPYRTTDCTHNVVRVGEEMATVFRAYGFQVIHDTTLCDYPAYNGAYDRSKADRKSVV